MKKILYFPILAALLLLSCKKEELPAEPQPETSQPEMPLPATTSRISFTHSNSICSLPVILLEDGTLFEGTVNWGDDSGEETYTEELQHRYSGSAAVGHRVDIIGPEPAAFEFEEIYGISKLDLSGLR